MSYNLLFQKIQKWFIRQSLEHAKRTIFISISLTLLVGYGMRFLIIDDDLMKMLPKNLDSRKSWESIQQEFGSTESIYIAFGNRSKSVFNKKDLETSWDLVKKLRKLKSVDNIINLSTITRIDNVDGFLEIKQLQGEAVLNKNQIESIQDYLNKNLKTKKQLVSRNESFLLTIVNPNTLSGLNYFRDDVVGVCSKVLVDYEIHYSGTAYITGSIPQLIRKDVKFLIQIGLVIMISILLINLRNIAAVLMILMVIIFSLTFMIGSMGWLFRFTGSDKFLFALLNTSMPIILLTIANSDGVHVITKYFKEIRFLKEPKKALVKTMETLHLPIFLTSITTIGAFSTMAFSPLEPLVGYGICISLGIVWAWVLSSVTLPALIILQKWDVESKGLRTVSLFEVLIDRLSNTVLKYPKNMLISGLFIIFISFVGVWSLKVDVNLSSFFKPGSEIRESMDFMDQEMTGTMDLRIRLEADMKDPSILKKVDTLQQFIEKNELITVTNSISDAVKQMHRIVMDDSLVYETIPNEKEKINNLFSMYSLSGTIENFSTLVNEEYSSGLITSFSQVMSTNQVFSFIEKISFYISSKFDNNISIDITGMIVVIRDMVILIIKSSIMSILLSLLFVILVASLFFKRFIWGLLAVLPLSGAVLLNFGLMGHFGITLNHITAILSSIIIGVGIDFAIHFIAQYRMFQKNNVKKNLTRKTFKETGYPILLDAASNMGFGALLFSSFIPVQFIGGLMVLAMISTSFGTLIILASLMQIIKKYILTN